MKYIDIKAKRQENGLWGTPINLVKVDKYIPFQENEEVLFSAIMVKLNQLKNSDKWKRNQSQ